MQTQIFVRAACAAALLLACGLPALADDATAAADLKFQDGKSAGVATMTETPAGVLVKLELKGLPPGPHGAGVFETGKCEGDNSSAGGTYNPLGAKHGFLNEDGPMAGDLPNVHVGADGAATVEFLTTFLNLAKGGEDNLLDADGAAIVLFESADDYLTEPDGGAGARLACGVIASK